MFTKPAQEPMKREAEGETVQQDPADRSAAIMAGGPYEYVFTDHSNVFHTRACRCMRHARSMEGTVFYWAAANNRRPCKVCRPQPVQEITIETPGFEKDGIQYQRKAGPDFGEIIRVRLLDGTVIETRRGHVVGHCRSTLHPGKMTKGILKQHDCIQKQCPCLVKYEEVPFWQELEKKKQQKSRNRKLKKERRAKRLAESERKLELRERFQRYAELADADLDVIRVECPNSRTFKIYYVSDNPYGDGAQFSDYQDLIREQHPDCLVALRHIRDVDGSFVTRDVFYAVKRR